MQIPRAQEVLTRLGRMARTGELKRLGVTEHELTRAVRAGEVVRPRQGVYALPDTAATWLHAAEHGGTVGCCAAGRLHGLWILTEPDVLHVWIGNGGSSPADCRACVLHWDHGRVEVGTLPPVPTVLLQIATCADEETFFAALESALRWSRISPGGLTWLWARLPVRLRWMVGFARADADSGLESLIRLRLHRIGIDVETQVLIHGVGEVDFVIGGRVIVEADGRENHARERERSKDLRRDAVAASRGYQSLRFTYAMIVHEWDLVREAILGAMRRAGLRVGQPGSSDASAECRSPARRTEATASGIPGVSRAGTAGRSSGRR